jgi:hypothetical protein
MRADDMDTRRTERERFLWMGNTLKTLLQQTDAYDRANEALLEAQHASRAETTLLRAEIETLMRKLEDYTATPPPPFTRHPNEQSLRHGGNVPSAIRSTTGHRGHPGRGMQPRGKEETLTEQRIRQHRTAIPHNTPTATAKTTRRITDPQIDALVTPRRRRPRHTRRAHATVCSMPDRRTVNHRTTPYPDDERRTQCAPTRRDHHCPGGRKGMADSDEQGHAMEDEGSRGGQHENGDGAQENPDETEW